MRLHNNNSISPAQLKAIFLTTLYLKSASSESWFLVMVMLQFQWLMSVFSEISTYVKETEHKLAYTKRGLLSPLTEWAHRNEYS